MCGQRILDVSCRMINLRFRQVLLCKKLIFSTFQCPRRGLPASSSSILIQPVCIHCANLCVSLLSEKLAIHLCQNGKGFWIEYFTFQTIVHVTLEYWSKFTKSCPTKSNSIPSFSLLTKCLVVFNQKGQKIVECAPIQPYTKKKLSLDAPDFGTIFFKSIPLDDNYVLSVYYIYM